MKLFDPIKIADETRKIIIRNNERKYYRIARPGRWYGGIATHKPDGIPKELI